MKRKANDRIETIPFILLLAALVLGLCVTYLSQPNKESTRVAAPVSDRNM